jgi:transposase-like protein
MPARLSAPHRRRQEAIERYLAGDPIEAICREMGCSKSWLYKWKERYEASQLTWFQERSRRPRTTPTQTPEALERAIIRIRDSVLPGKTRSVSAQVIREYLRQHYGELLPSRRTIYRILKRHPRR